LVTELSTDAFLAALRRFIGRRGKPSQMFSDNGTNFQGASKELKNFWLKEKDLYPEIAIEGIKWNFIPPNAPHMGGLWEAAVKSAKYHLRRVLGEALLTYEEMSTLLVQVEACLNSRPLCQLSSDPNDMEPLTPGHFLTGRSLLMAPSPDVQLEKWNVLDRWQRCQQLLQHFWNRWSMEYLPTLQRRTKWTQGQDNLQEGSLVLLKDANQPPSRWRLGRITETHPGKDKKTRVVTVKTAQGTYQRPITKLCPLPVQCDDSTKLGDRTGHGGEYVPSSADGADRNNNTGK